MEILWLGPLFLIGAVIIGEFLESVIKTLFKR